MNAAFQLYGVKLALDIGPAVMGASYGVAPRGNEVSDGTDRIQYARRGGQGSDVADHPIQGQYNADWLFNMNDMNHVAPGNASGFSNCSETIG